MPAGTWGVFGGREMGELVGNGDVRAPKKRPAKKERGRIGRNTSDMEIERSRSKKLVRCKKRKTSTCSLAREGKRYSAQT